MFLSHNEIGYFISQVGLAAQSFGVCKDDISTVGDSLTNIFNTKCSKPLAISLTPEPQSVCNGDDCPLATNNTCSDYNTNTPNTPNTTNTTNTTDIPKIKSSSKQNVVNSLFNILFIIYFF